MLTLENVTVGYGRAPVLRDLSLTLRRGEVLALVGPNGCGKSTLLKTALGLLPPQSGGVLLNGTPIAALSRRDIARRLSYLAQESTVPDLTVAQLALAGRYPHTRYPHVYTDADRAVAERALLRVGISHLADEPLSRLSGGTRKKAYLAMTLAQEAEGLLLDEPTASLDVASAVSLLSDLRVLAGEGRAVLTVLHDLPLAFTFADRVAILFEGKLVACDTPTALFRADAVTRVFGTALGYTEDAGYFYRLGTSRF